MRQRKPKYQQQIINIIESEVSTSKPNNRQVTDLYELGENLLNGYRFTDKYDWQSDVNIPEFLSIILTEQAILANQYFQTRDFVEVYLENDTEEDKKKCEVAKMIINKTLNRKGLHYFQKLMRAHLIMKFCGVVYFLCWWEKEIGQEVAFDPETSSFVPSPAVIKDHFNFDVIDPRNVFVSPEYTYSIQDKDYIIIRTERTLADLYTMKDQCNYFNLDILKSTLKPMTSTETAQETYNKNTNYMFAPTHLSPRYDVYERYGKFWAVVRERNEYNQPVSILPGIDDRGQPLDNAELVETVITYVKAGSQSVLIRFDPQLNFDSKGRPYRPIVRGTYYIHPSCSEGLSTLTYGINMQEAINDTINISNDRVMLATFPAFKAKKYSLDNVSEFVVSPSHPILLDNPVEDLVELKISDNIQGALSQFSVLVNQLQQLEAIYPTTMGDIPKLASTTATAVAGAEQRTNLRQLYKSICFEYTLLTDFYNMILQMTYQYMTPETYSKLIPEPLQPYFSPDADYTYKPVTSGIELEYAKKTKIQNYIQLLQVISNIQSPQILNLVNYIITEIAKLMGAEYGVVKELLISSIQPQEGQQQPILTPTGTPESIPFTSSNQYNIPMSPLETLTRTP